MAVLVLRPILGVGVVELGAADGGDLRNAGREADGQTFGGLGDDGEAIALCGAGIAGGREPRDALRAGLLGDGAEGGLVVGFATAETEAQDGGDVVIDGELRGVEDILVQ